jgi:hypothetical protein
LINHHRLLSYVCIKPANIATEKNSTILSIPREVCLEKGKQKKKQRKRKKDNTGTIIPDFFRLVLQVVYTKHTTVADKSKQ